ncbi:MAG: hypothetical protein GXO70_10650 [Acidobacteria bacterium]|nr:hypothetical protein [Acidobacteriota bacterium]
MVEHFQKKQLIQDSRLMFHQGDVPAPLARSVRREGVLMPLIATGGTNPVVLDGYRRLSLLADEDVVPIHVMKDRKAALRATVELNMLVSPYSEMEKAGIVVFVREACWMEDREILDTLLSRLGLKGQQVVLNNCMAVRLLDSKLFEVLSVRKAPLKFAVKLSREPLDEQLTLAELFTTCKLSMSQMVQAYDLLIPVRKRENAVFSKVIEGLDREGGDVLALLRQKRFPQATGIRKELNSLLRRYRGRLKFPEDLEGDAFGFSCLLKCPEDAREYVAMLREISEDDALFHFLAEHVGND